MKPEYVPEQGDIVWLQFDPQAGREQSGHRPAVVLSPQAYNAKVGLLVCCPMTTTKKGYPFEYALTGSLRSVVLADQVKSVDWTVRRATHKGRVGANDLEEIRMLVAALIGL